MTVSGIKRAGQVLRALRPHQWAKNTLVFLPLMLAQRWGEWNAWLIALLVFAAFCLAASGVYVVNDILDVEADRRHPSKKNRPFAAGVLTPRFGVLLAGLLFVGALGLSVAVFPFEGAIIIVLYALLSTSYSLWLKRFLMVDVLVLSGLYALRILGGGLATGTPVSRWLLAFSGFFFLSLAFAKRYTELHQLSVKNTGEEKAAGRGYRVSDLSLVESLGPTSGYLAVLVLALYINSEQMMRYYANPWALWLICPLLVYWLSRVWFLAKRGELHDDPVIFALGDAVSWMVAVLVVVFALLAIFLPSVPLSAAQ
jgi:4-hydroxybenzoate polyprenyltransferase